MKEKTENIAELKAFNIADVRRCIYLIDGLKMEDELFNKIADEFAEYLVDKWGLDMLEKMDHISLIPKFWQLKYCASPT